MKTNTKTAKKNKDIPKTNKDKPKTKTKIAEELKKLAKYGKDGSPPPRQVKLSYFVRRVSDIDLVKQRFHVSFHFKACWEEEVSKIKERIQPKNESEERKKQAGSQWMKEDFPWDPQLKFTNLVNEEGRDDPEIWYRVMRLDDGMPTNESISFEDFEKMNSDEKVCVMHCENTQGWFDEKMELKTFPFDNQLLHIGMTSTWDKENVLLSFDHYRGIKVAQDVLTLQSYTRHQPRLLAYNEKIYDEEDGTSLPLLSNKDDSVTGVQYSRAYLALSVARKPHSVFWNVLFIIFLLGTTSLFTFSIQDGEIGDRHSSILTLLLTAVAFKYVTVTILPDVPYMTYMDHYTLLTIVLQCMIYMLVSLPFDTSNSLSWYKTWQFISSAVVWIFFNMIFWCKVGKALYDRRRELNEWDKYHNDIAEIENIHKSGRKKIEELRKSGKGRLLNERASLMFQNPAWDIDLGCEEKRSKWNNVTVEAVLKLDNSTVVQDPVHNPTSGIYLLADEELSLDFSTKTPDLGSFYDNKVGP